MTVKDLFEETSTALSANKVRSGLTILGIVIGISSVIALVSVGEGAQASIQASDIQSIGSNLLGDNAGSHAHDRLRCLRRPRNGTIAYTRRCQRGRFAGTERECRRRRVLRPLSSNGNGHQHQRHC